MKPDDSNGYLSSTIALKAAAGFILVAGLIWLERKYLLRQPVENPNRRLLRNTGIGLISAIALNLVERPLTAHMAEQVALRRLGLLHWAKVPDSLHPVVGIILMDYTLYVWHVMLHKVPFLWRHHIAHHTDLDLDTSTAWRFHFGELLPSVLWRLLQIRVVGINVNCLTTWQTFLGLCILFHHSNLRLPMRVERILSRFIVTPRMHGIHHSIVPEEQNSNWSSGLTLWDRAHGTLNTDLEREDVVVGVPAFLDKRQVGFWQTLAVPYTQIEGEWNLPPDKRIAG